MRANHQGRYSLSLTPSLDRGRVAWLAPQYAGATFALDGDGSMSGIPGAAYLNGTYYNALADVPGASITGGAGFATGTTLDGRVIGPFAPNTLPATDAGVEGWEARTNYFWPSVLTNSALTKTNTTVSDGSTVAPNGSAEAIRIAENSATGIHTAGYSKSAAFDTPLTGSVFVKAGERTKVRVEFTSNVGNSGVRLTIDLSAVTIVAVAVGSLPATGASGTITALANGWFRVTGTYTPGGTGNTSAGILVSLLDDVGAISYTGDPAKGIYIWGAQLEAGSRPSPYIPTTSAAATRTALATSLGSAAINTSLATEGTLITTFSKSNRAATGSTGAIFLDGSNYIEIRNDPTSIGGVVSVGGTSYTAGVSDANPISGKTAAISWKVGEQMRIAFSGSTSTSAATVASMFTPNGGRIGRGVGYSYLNDRVQRMVILPTYLAIAQLQALTA